MISFDYFSHLDIFALIVITAASIACSAMSNAASISQKRRKGGSMWSSVPVELDPILPRLSREENVRIVQQARKLSQQSLVSLPRLSREENIKIMQEARKLSHQRNVILLSKLSREENITNMQQARQLSQHNSFTLRPIYNDQVIVTDSHAINMYSSNSDIKHRQSFKNVVKKVQILNSFLARTRLLCEPSNLESLHEERDYQTETGTKFLGLPTFKDTTINTEAKLPSTRNYISSLEELVKKNEIDTVILFNKEQKLRKTREQMLRKLQDGALTRNGYESVTKRNMLTAKRSNKKSIQNFGRTLPPLASNHKHLRSYQNF